MSPEDEQQDGGYAGRSDDNQPRIHLERKGCLQTLKGWKYFHLMDIWEAASFGRRTVFGAALVLVLGGAAWYLYAKSGDLGGRLITEKETTREIQQKLRPYGGVDNLVARAGQAEAYQKSVTSLSAEQERLQKENKGLQEQAKKIAGVSNLEGQVTLLQNQIEQILAETPYLQSRGFSYQKMDADGDGRYDGEEYASYARVLRFERGNPPSLQRTLQQLRREQGYASQFEGSLSVLKPEEKQEILGEFTRDDVRVYFDSPGNLAGVENLKTGRVRSYRYAVMREGGKR